MWRSLWWVWHEDRGCSTLTWSHSIWDLQLFFLFSQTCHESSILSTSNFPRYYIDFAFFDTINDIYVKHGLLVDINEFSLTKILWSWCSASVNIHWFCVKLNSLTPLNLFWLIIGNDNYFCCAFWSLTVSCIILLSPCNSVGGDIVMRPFMCVWVSGWVCVCAWICHALSCGQDTTTVFARSLLNFTFKL